jgi:hypothetical protein
LALISYSIDFRSNENYTLIEISSFSFNKLRDFNEDDDLLKISAKVDLITYRSIRSIHDLLFNLHDPKDSELINNFLPSLLTEIQIIKENLKKLQYEYNKLV